MRIDRLWTIRQAGRWGLLAGIVSALLWPVHALVLEPARPWFMIALAATAICGASMILFTLIDLATVRRGRSVLPARMFDLAFGLLLAAPSAAALIDLSA